MQLTKQHMQLIKCTCNLQKSKTFSLNMKSRDQIPRISEDFLFTSYANPIVSKFLVPHQGLEFTMPCCGPRLHNCKSTKLSLCIYVVVQWIDC